MKNLNKRYDPDLMKDFTKERKKYYLTISDFLNRVKYHTNYTELKYFNNKSIFFKNAEALIEYLEDKKNDKIIDNFFYKQIKKYICMSNSQLRNSDIFNYDFKSHILYLKINMI